MTLGEKLKDLRLHAGMTQKQLADKLSVSQNAIYNWENGKRDMRIDVIKQICHVLNIDTDYFFVDENDIDYNSYFQAIKPVAVPADAVHLVGLTSGFFPPKYHVYSGAQGDTNYYFVYPDNYVLISDDENLLEELEKETEDFIAFKLEMLRKKS